MSKTLDNTSPKFCIFASKPRFAHEYAKFKFFIQLAMQQFFMNIFCSMLFCMSKKAFTFIDIVDQIHKVAYTRIISHTSQHSLFFLYTFSQFVNVRKAKQEALLHIIYAR